MIGDTIQRRLRKACRKLNGMTPKQLKTIKYIYIFLSSFKCSIVTYGLSDR